jgi:hypothetical protein
VEEAEAGDSSAMTYAKVGCLGLKLAGRMMWWKFVWWIDSYRIFDYNWDENLNWLNLTHTFWMACSYPRMKSPRKKNRRFFSLRPGVPWRETDRRNDGPKQGSERRIGFLLKQFVTTSQIVIISYVWSCLEFHFWFGYHCVPKVIFLSRLRFHPPCHP